MNAARGNSLPAARPFLAIEPSSGWVPLRLKELWEYRELLFFLTWRDIKVRYKQTVLGAAWAIIQPFSVMVVFSVIFGRLIKVTLRWHTLSGVFLLCLAAVAAVRSLTG